MDSPYTLPLKRTAQPLLSCCWTLGRISTPGTWSSRGLWRLLPPSSLTEGFLLVYEATPQPLSQLCRQRIRDCVGRDRFHLINHLPLPNPLKNYLQYR
ncbi:hypothetical protein J4Q44_G00316150 [Coregonus suidteri]|uniref:SOCS box domain-containing protein n=1 Tax=Coregonus suidteri TaxID=861788 RepID=A0AAN8L037_9TELE